MRIGIDCRKILHPGFGEKAGVGHYTYYLVKNLLRIDKKNSYVLFFDSLLYEPAAKELVGDNRNAELKFFPFHQYKKYLPFAYSHLLTVSFIVREKLDVFHATANILPMQYKGKSVVTVHDLAIYKHPEWFPKKILSRQVSTKLLVPKSLKMAERIIAVSKSTKKDIKELFNIPDQKIKVIYEGVDIKDWPESRKLVCGIEEITCREELFKRYDISKKYILYIGTIEPRKNLEILVGAFGSLMFQNKKLAQERYQLIIAGARGWKFKKVFDAISKVNKELQKKYQGGEFVKYLGYVSHADKLALLQNSTCFAFPSLYEGFGLPVLEAMSFGAPVLTSRVSSLPEVVGDAGILINPNEARDIRTGLERILSDKDLRDELSSKAENRAKEFSWEKTARETLEVYESLQ